MTEIVSVGFGENTGTTAADSSGSGRNITGIPGWTTGPSGHGSALDTNTQVGGTIALPALTNYTIMFWCLMRGTGSWASYVEDSAGAAFWFEHNATNVVDANWASGADFQTGYTQPVNTWVHLALTVSGSTATLIVNGVQSNTGAGAALAAGNYFVGGSTGQPGNMSIDDFRVFDTALTAAQVAGIMNDSIEVPAGPATPAFDETAFDSTAFLTPDAAPGAGSASLSLSASAGATVGAAGTASISLSATATAVQQGGAAGTASLSLSAAAGAAARAAGSAVLSLAASGASRAVAAATASLSLSGSVTFVNYIASVSANGRYFLDQTGKPFLVIGDAPWSILLNSSTAHMDTYLTARAAQGFNTLIVSFLGNTHNGGPSDTGATFDGILPFVGGNPGSLTAAYWDRVEYFLSKAQSLGITVWAYPLDAWTGTAEYNGLGQSWTNAQALAYGTALAARMASHPNIVWGVGGDYTATGNASGSADDQRFWNVLQGLINNGASRIKTIQFTLESYSIQDPYWKDKVDWSHVYTYSEQYNEIQTAYGATNTAGNHVPALMSESFYEAYAGTTPLYFRHQLGWSLTSGSPGIVYGSEDVWDADPQEPFITTAVSTTLAKVAKAVAAIPGWEKVVPDYASTFITAGRGTKANNSFSTSTANTYVTGGVAPDGSIALLYIPNAASTVTIDQSKMSAGYTATWLDPGNATTVAATPGSTYTRATANSAGGPDWYLILQGSASAPASGSAALALSASGAARASGGGAAALALSASGATQSTGAGSAALALSASGAARASGGGAAALALSASGAAQSTGAGAAVLALSASGATQSTGAGSASILLDASGSASTLAAGAGAASLALAAAGTALQPGGGTSALVLSASGAGRAAATSTAILALSASGAGRGLAAGAASLALVATAASGGSSPGAGAASLVIAASGSSWASAVGFAAISLGASSAAQPSFSGTAGLTLLAAAGATFAGVGGGGTLALFAWGTPSASGAGSASVTLVAGFTVEEAPNKRLAELLARTVEVSLRINKKMTTAFIASDPTVIVLIPRTREPKPAGGWAWAEQAPRAPQAMKLVEQSGLSGQPRPLVTLDGVERAVEFELVAEWNADLERGDVFTLQGKEWEIVGVYYENGYERRGLVSARG